MKLTNRQLQSINNILVKEDHQKNSKFQNDMQHKKLSLRNETMLFEDINVSDIPQQLVNDLDDFSLDYSQGQISKINKLVYQSLASLLQKATGESMRAEMLAEELEEFDVYEHEMALASDIREAICTYARAIAEEAMAMVGTTEKNDDEPHYSEYE